MKSTDRMILLGVALVGLVAVFWFLILSPKREEAAELKTEATELEAQVSEAEQAAAASDLAKRDFANNYRQLITLGKAVPIDADTPSLLTQLQGLSDEAGIGFQSIALTTSGAAAAAPVATDTAAVPTEATASLLPIGASIGPAGLPTMGYTMKFGGGFFEISDFFGLVDGMVVASDNKVEVDGRLLTIDGFTLSAGPGGFPSLTAEVQATSYLTPADQGITAGASPTGPAPTTPAPAETAPVDPATDPAVSATVVAN